MPHRTMSRRVLLLAASIPVAVWAAAGSLQPAIDPTVRPTIMTEDCTTACHGELMNHRVMHGPTAQGECAICHTSQNPAEHLFKLATDADELCAQCHIVTLGDVTHTPVAEGNCSDCHDPHGSEYQMMLKADLQRDLCLTCHEDVTQDAAFVHGPVADGACIVCHEAHSSRHENLLKQSANTTCLSCHDEVKVRPEVGLEVHGAIDEGCVSCHDPHASEHKYQLRDTTAQLCVTCHDHMKPMLSDTFEGVVHGPMADADSCTQCHDPHSSRLDHLQKTEQPEMCLKCHDREIDVGEQFPLTNMSALLANNPSHHGPIREGQCTACHQPHAGEHFRLLHEEYPPEFYAPFDIKTFELCFSCHIPEMVESESGRGLTGFRDGDTNLRWLHVNREKGRTCRACHEVHASKQSAHIRDSVPFGPSGWLLKIQFVQTESGGSCASACHKTRSYQREPGAPTPSEIQP